MILRRLRVEGLRCFADPVELGPLDERIQVIHAPNGSGKSTLFLALRRVLLDRYAVGGDAAESLRPWGRKLAPVITVEFAHDGEEYLLTKRFLDSPSAELARRENGVFTAFAKDEKADEFVRNLLGAPAPARGLSDRRHWGLFQALWATQEEPDLEGLGPDLVARVRESLGAQAAGEGAGVLEARVERVYGEIFTPGGKLLTGQRAARLRRLEDERSRLEEERVLAADRHGRLDAARRAVEDRRAEQAQARRDSDALRDRFAKARTLAREYADALAARERREEQVRAEEEKHRGLLREGEERGRAERDLADAVAARDRADADLAAAETAEAAARKAAEAAAEALRSVRAGAAVVEEAARLAKDARLLRDEQARAAELASDLSRLAEAEEGLERAARARAEVVAPDDLTLHAIREAVAACSEARAALEAAALSLVIEADGPLEVRSPDAEDPEKPARLAPGDALRLKGAPGVSAEIEGVARIRARGPAGAAEEWRAKLERAEERLRELTTGFGTHDAAALEALAAKARSRDRDLDRAKVVRDTIAEGASAAELREAQARSTGVVEDLLARHAEWTAGAPDPDVLEDAADRAAREHEAAEERARGEKDSREARLAETRRELAAVRARGESAVGRLAAAEERIAELSRAGTDPEERRRLLDETALHFDAARGALAQAKEVLDRFDSDPREEEEILRRRIDEAKDRASTALAEEKAAEARLDDLASAGSYGLLTRAEEEIAALDLEIGAERVRTEAVRLLRDTLKECRADALAAVSGPVEEAATRLFRRIAGPRLGAVRLGEALSPAGVRPSAADAEVEESELSGGESEQLHLAVRLALAESLARDQRQLLVLDDILTATDTGRLARVLRILEEAADRLQIVILTCHPERYAGLQSGGVLDLGGRLRGEGDT